MSEAYAFAGTTMTVLVPGEATNNSFAVLHVVKPNGSSTPPHSHDEETELSYVLSGSLGVEMEGQDATVGAGNFVVLPPGRPHRLYNKSSTHVREFLLCTPAKFDRFIAAAGTLVEPYAEPHPMTDEDRRRLVATAPDFGIRLLPSATPNGGVSKHAASSGKMPAQPNEYVEVLTRLGETDEDIVLLKQSLPPGADILWQNHDDHGCIFLIAGELDVCENGLATRGRKLGFDQAIHFGPGTHQAIRNGGSMLAEFLVVTTVRMARRLNVAA